MSIVEQPQSEAEDAVALRVRHAQASDIAAVTGLDERNTGMQKPDYWEDMFERFGNHPERLFLVAEGGKGQLLGFIIGEVRAWEFGSPPCGWIFALGVDPSVRLKKIGSRLFAAICERLARAGVSTVRTMLARDDDLNMAFFRSQGMMGGPFIQLEMPLAADRANVARRGAKG
ncbi:MAG: GNAT family N-acetyltransferase [Gammaproteobacteria bacterium]